MTGEQAAAIIGPRTYYGVDVLDALHDVRGHCPDGWQADYTVLGENVPSGATVVGRVRGDRVATLYIRPI